MGERTGQGDRWLRGGEVEGGGAQMQGKRQRAASCVLLLPEAAWAERVQVVVAVTTMVEAEVEMMRSERALQSTPTRQGPTTVMPPAAAGRRACAAAARPPAAR